MKKCSATVLAGIMLFKAGLSTNIFAADNSSDSEFSVKSGLSTVKKVNTAFEYVKSGMLGFLAAAVGVGSAGIIYNVCKGASGSERGSMYDEGSSSKPGSMQKKIKINVNKCKNMWGEAIRYRACFTENGHEDKCDTTDHCEFCKFLQKHGVDPSDPFCGLFYSFDFCKNFANANSPRSSHNNSQRSFFADSDGTCDLGEPGTFRVHLEKFAEFEEEVDKVLRFINDSNNSGEAKACEIAKLENYFYKEVVTEFGVDGRAYGELHNTIDNHSNISFSGKISGAYFNRNIFSKVRQLASKMQSCRGSDKAQRLFWAFQSIKHSLNNQANSSHICA